MRSGAILTGDRKLDRKLRTLKASHQRRVARPAIRQASGEVRKAAKRKAPSRYRMLIKSIKNVVRTGRGVVYGVVGPATGMEEVIDGKNVVPAMYAHWVEYGTRPHLISPRGQKGAVKTLKIGQRYVEGAVQHPGAQAQPYMRPAYRGTPAKAIIQKRTWTEIQKLAAKS